MDRLRETIEAANAQSQAQTDEMVKLTRRIAWLTWVVVIVAAVQVAIAAGTLFFG